VCAVVGVTFGIGLAFAPPSFAQRYTATRAGETIRLADATTTITVAIVPSAGNMAVELRVKGHDVLRWPFASMADFLAKPAMSGIPFVGPWANRLDEQAFYANGQRYPFDMTLGNVRGAIPIHGFLTTAREWQVVDMGADASSAWVTSRLEVFRQPSWMAQWPFAHTIEITHRLQDGALEVATSIANLSADAMPVAIGFHPYFQLTDAPRDTWRVSIGARTWWALAATKVPTGETVPIDQLLPGGVAAPLRDYNLDDVFSDLVRDPRGRATMTVEGRAQRLDIVLGPNYRSVVVWAPNPAGTGRGSQGASPPAERNFICIEPMAGITNGINLAHRGVYKELQVVPPGGTWRESFWVRPSGF
jgi:aldose 1-epimerase